ncbi:MAG TPA: two-component regulator propeller domain-containing protein, partial [Vicinamibacterales bacterium]|nr:two-component regulator propeller domain-containing protein [Vicinamibacterales bacterium]
MRWLHRQRGPIVAGGIALSAALLAARPAFALNASLDVSQYVHTAWRVRDGFVKGTTQTIAQTADGYIWIGTDSGLYRFDGVRVTAWQPPPGEELPSTTINNLLVTRDGTLWIATAFGLASWNGRTLSDYPVLNGRFIGKLLEDRAGTMWITAANLTTVR